MENIDDKIRELLGYGFKTLASFAMGATGGFVTYELYDKGELENAIALGIPSAGLLALCVSFLWSASGIHQEIEEYMKKNKLK